MDIPPENREGTPEALVYPLMEHQKLGLAWMKAMEEGSNKGGILADDMGLGKTIQALALIVARPSLNKKCKTTLIVAPLSLLKQWEREIQKKLKQNYALTVYIHHGTAKRYKTFKELTKFDVVLTTFGTIATEYRRKLAAIEMIKTQPEVVLNEDDYLFTGKTSVWYRVIIDEAQCIKNRETLGARGCAELTATYRFCLSGTPMQNRCDEIYSLIRFLRIKPYSDWTNFNRDFSKPFKSKSSSDHGVRDSMRKFQALLKAFLLRRTKASQIDGKPILTLPPKTIEVVHSVFSSEEQNFYNALQSKTLIQFNKYLRANSIGKNYSNILVLLLRMRQACCHPHLINDIEVNGEVSEDAMEVLAKDLPPAAVTRLKESGIEECPICMDTSNNPSIVLPCGHGFCNDCIVQVYNTATQQGLARGDENAGARCPGCRGNLDIKKIIDWNTFQKVYLKEAKEDNGTPEASKKNGLNADALAKLRRDARRNAASKRQYIEYLEDNWMPSAKITKCLEILERVHTNDPSEKTIIFSQWTSLLDLLEVPIFRKNWGYRRYDGTMTSTERNDAIIDFTDDPSVNVMLVSLKAGNSGLNLVAASQVILFDPCYNPYVEDQAIDRAHRIGQQRPVVVHKLSIKGTVEDKVLALQEEKKAVIGSALDENASKGIARLGARDLAFLFGIDGAQLARMG
ncbi:SNF2 family N-terminal domain-containing protein [Peziza echinospora]|nr:SNF2 family N-terminal domain-containing protein [Peziza echinospora]